MFSVLESERVADHQHQITSALLEQLTGCATDCYKYLLPDTIIKAVAGVRDRPGVETLAPFVTHNQLPDS
jgi:hypothetical protein